MDISHAIRLLRKRKGWTQQQLADFSNTSKSNISNLENGNQGYSPALLQYLARAFDCRVSQIFLIAEQLEKQSDNTQLDWYQMPPEFIMTQLPDNLKNAYKALMIETLKSLEK